MDQFEHYNPQEKGAGLLEYRVREPSTIRIFDCDAKGSVISTNTDRPLFFSEKGIERDSCILTPFSEMKPHSLLIQLQTNSHYNKHTTPTSAIDYLDQHPEAEYVLRDSSSLVYKMDPSRKGFVITYQLGKEPGGLGFLQKPNQYLQFRFFLNPSEPNLLYSEHKGVFYNLTISSDDDLIKALGTLYTTKNGVPHTASPLLGRPPAPPAINSPLTTGGYSSRDQHDRLFSRGAAIQQGGPIDADPPPPYSSSAPLAPGRTTTL